MINSIISFKKIPIIKVEKLNLPTEYKVKLKNEGDCFVRTDVDYVDNMTTTSIDLEENYDIAQSKAEIDKGNKLLFNNNMDVLRRSHRGKGLGVVLHLNNIIEMFENNLDKIKLFSLGQSVIFHAKCGFEPDINNVETMENVLYEISMKDCSDFPEIRDIVKDAAAFDEKITNLQRNNKSFSIDYKKANDIVKRYLNVVSRKKLYDENREKYGFIVGFPMVLTKEKILDNKDFYNSLFKKFDIDYKI